MNHPYVSAAKRLGGLVAPVYHSLLFPPFVVFMAIMVASVFGWQSATHSLTQDIDSAVDSRTLALENDIGVSLNAYEQVLRGGVGLFQGSDEVTARDWRNYLDAFNLASDHPGVQGIGYAKVIRGDQLKALQAFMAEQEVHDFAIRPAEPPREQYAPVIFLQTIAAKTPAAFGFDLYSDPAREQALFRARDTTETTITGRLKLNTADTSTPPIGFNMYAPYYGTTAPPSESARHEQVQGYVFAAFRAHVFFRNIVERVDSRAMGFSVVVWGDPTGQPLYESEGFQTISHQRDVVRTSRAYHTYGQTWRIRYVLDAGHLVSDVQLRRPEGVLFFGFFSAILISTIIWLLLRARARQLLVQKEQAVELAKDELLSLASHQLRTPATGVKQYIGMVLQGFAGKVKPDQRMLLEKAYASNDRQLRIINEILHLAKIDAGRIILARQETNVNELVNDVVNEQLPDIKNAGHFIKLQLLKRPLILNTDTHMLRMAVENILSNAVKYTPTNGRIKIRVYKDKQNAYIELKDNGVGIKPADLELIFKQFSRLPNEMSQQVGGTGIGLYLAKHLVQLHGGTIHVQSAPHKGSAFTIVLPLRENNPDKGP